MKNLIFLISLGFLGLASSMTIAQSIPTTFEQVLLQIGQLEQDAQYGQALSVCSTALTKFPEADRKKLLTIKKSELEQANTKSVELAAALKNLETAKDASLEEARAQLMKAGELGRAHLRKAAKSGNDPALKEAGALLNQLGDPAVPGLFVDRIQSNPAAATAAVAAELLKTCPNRLAFDEMDALARIAMLENVNRDLFMNLIFDSLEQALPSPKADTPPDLSQLSAHLTLAHQSQLNKTLIAYLEHRAARRNPAIPKAEAAELATIARAEQFLAEARLHESPAGILQKLTSEAKGPTADYWRQRTAVVADRFNLTELNALNTYTQRADIDHTATMNLFLDALEAPVTTIRGNKDKEKRIVDYDKLRDQIDNATQANISAGIIAYIRRVGAEPKEAEPTVVRAGTLLAETGFGPAPSLIVTELTRNPPPALAARWVGILDQSHPRIDPVALKALADYAAPNGPHQAIAVKVLVSTVDQLATTLPPGSAPGQRGTAKYETLPARLDKNLQASVVRAFLNYLVNQPADKQDPKLAESIDKILTKARFPATPTTLVTDLQSVHQDPKALPYIEILSKMTDRVDELDARHQSLLITALIAAVEKRVAPGASAADQKAVQQAEQVLTHETLMDAPLQLATKLTQVGEGPMFDWLLKVLTKTPQRINHASLRSLISYTHSNGDGRVTGVMNLVIDALEARAFAPNPVVTSGNRWATQITYLPSRIATDMQVHILNGMVRYVEIKAAKPTAADQATLTRVEAFLVGSNFPEAPQTLTSKLLALKPGPPAERIAGVLKKMPGKLDPSTILKLTGHIHPGGEQQKPALDLLITELDRIAAVPQYTGRPNQPGTPKYATLPSRVDTGMHGTILQALISYTIRNAGKDQPGVDRAGKVISEADFLQTPSRLTSELVKNPPAPAAAELVKLLKAQSQRIDKATMKTLSTFAAKDGPNKAVATELVLFLAAQ